MTILDTLQSAQLNLVRAIEPIGPPGLSSIALAELTNAINALEDGKAPNDVLPEKKETPGRAGEWQS